MQSYYFVTLVTILEVLTILSMGSAAPLSQTCNQSLINSIHDFWRSAGTPRNAIKLVEANGDHVIVHSTYNYANGEEKCVIMNGIAKDNKLSFIFKSKIDNHKLLSLDYEVDQENGMVSSKNGDERTYTILDGNNVTAFYSCSTIEGANGPAVGFITSAHKNWLNDCTQTQLKFVRGLMEMWGFVFLYVYGEECFE